MVWLAFVYGSFYDCVFPIDFKVHSKTNPNKTPKLCNNVLRIFSFGHYFAPSPKQKRSLLCNSIHQFFILTSPNVKCKMGITPYDKYESIYNFDCLFSFNTYIDHPSITFSLYIFNFGNFNVNQLYLVFPKQKLQMESYFICTNLSPPTDNILSIEANVRPRLKRSNKWS